MVLQECEQEIPVSYMERQTLFQKLKGDLLIVGIILLLAATFFLINVIRDRQSSGEGSVLVIRDGSLRILPLRCGLQNGHSIIC